MKKRIPLSKAYTGFGAPVSEAFVSEPTGGIYLDLGEPYERQFTAAGEPVIIENTAAVRGYIERCVTFVGETADPTVILNQLSLADIRAVKAAVVDFFEVARGSETSSTSSPSAPDGSPATSSD